jgi:hypothetical protein
LVLHRACTIYTALLYHPYGISQSGYFRFLPVPIITGLFIGRKLFEIVGKENYKSINKTEIPIPSQRNQNNNESFIQLLYQKFLGQNIFISNFKTFKIIISQSILF